MQSLLVSRTIPIVPVCYQICTRQYLFYTPIKINGEFDELKLHHEHTYTLIFILLISPLEIATVTVWNT